MAEVAGESSYVERAPTPALAAYARSVWIQQVGDRPVSQRHEPHGGAELRCVLGEAPRLLGPLTAATFREIPAGGTVVGVRLRPGVLGGLVGLPADELRDQDVACSDIWRDLARVQAANDRPDATGVTLARWAVEAGYHDQAHLSRECRRLLGVTPGEYLAQSRDACTCGHDHAASYLPMLGPRNGRSVQERRSVPA
jgi:AraC-like DNA-binding protein